MSCSYCNQKAIHKCKCNNPYMCSDHLNFHLASKPDHKYEDLSITLSPSTHLETNSDILKAIHKFNQAKNEISLKVSSLIERLIRLQKKITETLDGITKKYHQILHQEKLCKSDIAMLRKVKTLDVKIKSVEFDGIISQIEKLFPQELIFQNENYLIIGIKDLEEEISKRTIKGNYIKSEANKEGCGWKEEEFLTMDKTCTAKIDNVSVRSKIESFHRSLWINFPLASWGSISNCLNWIKDLLTSKNEKYLFVYLNFEGYSYLDIWDLNTKSCIIRWCTSHKEKNCFDDWEESLRKWISVYPECNLRSWDFNALT